MPFDTEHSTQLRSGGQHDINLVWGKPAPSLLPIKQLAQAAQAVFADNDIAVSGLEYNESLGHYPLRKELSLWLGRCYTAQVSPEQLCISGGASQALATILQVFTDPLVTRAVWMAEPCYYLASRIFEDAGLSGKLRPISEDRSGTIDLDSLERDLSNMEQRRIHQLERDSQVGDPEASTVQGKRATAKPNDPLRKTYQHVIYVVPTFSNPSGATMPLHCRQRLVDLARRYDVLIISDDIYDLLQWPAAGVPVDSRPLGIAQLPRLVDLDRRLPRLSSDQRQFGHVISNGSFSKVVAPGLRCGWVDASKAIALALSDCGSTRSGGCPSGIIAAVVTELFKDGFLDSHVCDTLIPAYARRRAMMIKAIERHLEPLGVHLELVETANGEGDRDGSRPLVGGYFLWLRLPPGILSTDIVRMAKAKENLLLSPGRAFAVLGQHERRACALESYLRLSFSWSDDDDLIEGVRRLGSVIRQLQGKGISCHSDHLN